MIVFFIVAAVNVAFTFAPVLMIAYLTQKLVNEDAWSCHKTKTTTASATDDKKEEHETEKAPVTVHEDASARVTVVGDDKIHVVVAVPGVRSADLTARVIDEHVLRIIGETKRGSDVYRVAKDIALPSIDMETMSATHEDGVLTIVVKRKIHQVDIPITSSSASVEAPSTAAPSAPATKEEEWEPLPRAADGEGDKTAANVD